MSSGLYSGTSGLALGTGLYRDVSGLWGGASGLVAGFGDQGPILALDFSTGSLDSRITFTRASSATRVNSSGLIETVSTDVARFDYSPVSPYAARGLLIEEARTNSQTYSEQFNNAAWNKSSVAVAANDIASPDGTTTADKITGDGTSNTHLLAGADTLAVARTISVYAKYGTHRYIQIYLDGTLDPVANFDLVDGVAYDQGINQTASIVDAGGGWYRCIMYTASTATSGINIVLVNSSTSGRYEGNTASGYVYLWGAQLEAGAFATSYIPTVAATVTRAADVASMTGTNFSDWYSQAEGSFIVTATSPASGTRAIISADDNTANEAIKLYTSTADPKMIVTDGGATQADIDAGSITALTSFKLGGAYKVNDFAVSVNGGAEVTDVSGTIPTPDRLRIGTDQAGNYLNGPILALDYYNTRAALGSLTA